MPNLSRHHRQILKNVNNRFNWQFNKMFLPKYMKNNVELPPYTILENHMLAIKDRVDFKHICVTVDPESCVDADDGFSVYSETVGGIEKLYLSIHIADPTHFIPHDSELFQAICKNSITHYPSMNQSIHLMPRDIINRSSLTPSNGNKYDEPKNAISIVTEIDQIKYLPVGNPELQFTRVIVTHHDRFSYEQAALYLLNPGDFKVNLNKLKSSYDIKKCKNVQIFNVALNISKALHASRTTIGKKLEHFRSNLKYTNGVVELYEDYENIKDMKSVVAEFAIFTNSFIGEYLNTNVDKTLGIYRACNTDKLDSDVKYQNSGNIKDYHLMDKIIKTHTTATYTQTNDSHGLVGAHRYTHFTSPIRRASDCICHYLVKYIYNIIRNTTTYIEKPFKDDQLNKLILHIDQKSKYGRKLQYADMKFRTTQAINSIVIIDGTVQLRIQFTGYRCSYLNFSINRVNEFYTSIPYNLLLKNYPQECIDYLTNYDNGLEDPDLSNIMVFNITYVNIPRKFDAGTFPEFDLYINGLEKQIANASTDRFY
jgi:exoribonuclease R